MRAFAKATPISSPSVTTTRSLLYETQSLRRWMSHRSGSSPLSARPTRRFSAAPAAAGPRIPYSYSATLSSENSSIRANFFCDVANAVLFFWNSTHRDGMSPLRESLLSRLALFSESNPPLAPSRFFPPRDLRGKRRGAEDLSARRWVNLRRLYPRIPHSLHREFSPVIFNNS